MACPAARRDEGALYEPRDEEEEDEEDAADDDVRKTREGRGAQLPDGAAHHVRAEASGG